MARLRRFALLGQPQHVVQRGNNRCPTFHADADYRAFLDWLLNACERFRASVHAYVLMTNHVHLLVTPHDEGSIGSVMQSVGSRYVPYFNRKYARSGTLWEGRYRATLIDSERYLFACYRYIELNPVRAGLVVDPRSYPWSSYAANALGFRDPLVTSHERFLALGSRVGERMSAYRELFKDALDEEIVRDIREATHNAWALGHPRPIGTGLNRRLHRLTRTGRPKGSQDRENGVRRCSREMASDPVSRPKKGV